MKKERRNLKKDKRMIDNEAKERKKERKNERKKLKKNF